MIRAIQERQRRQRDTFNDRALHTHNTHEMNCPNKLTKIKIDG